MAHMSSSASNLPWLWVIETLASSKQVDASLLIDLVEQAPGISDNMGENARELMSLRILECFFAQRSEFTNHASSDADSEIGFDPSVRCEDVLRSILQKSSAINLHKDGPDMSKMDLQSFIVHKRSFMPKCALTKLKDAIVEAKHPLFASLQERSGLEIKNQDNIDIPMDDGEANSENLEEKSLENQAIVGNGFTVHSDVTKKFKQDASCNRQAVNQASVSLHGMELGEDSASRNARDAGREGSDLSKEPLVRCLKDGRFSKDGFDEDPASKRLGLSSDADDTEFLPKQRKTPFTDKKFPQDTSGDSQSQNICVDETKEDSIGLSDVRTSDGLLQDANQPEIDFGARGNHGPVCHQNALVNVPPDKDKVDEDHNREQEMSSDSDGYHDERLYITTKKRTFLSSHCVQSQESLATANFSELSLCTKCNAGGLLLVCSSEACPLVVHEECVGSVPSFDRTGKFYCPFCAYSQSISEYLEAKKKASLARKDLAAFIGLGTENRPKKSKRLHRTLRSQSRQGEEMDENRETNDNKSSATEFNNPQSGVNQEDKRQAEASVSCANGNPACVEKGAVATNEMHCSLMEDKQVAGNGGQECLHAESRKQRGVLHQPATPFSNPSASRVSTDADESSVEANDDAVASTYFIRFRRPERKYTYPSIPQLRRQKLPWTKVEEETLKEGVRRFSSVHDKNIPWTKILDFGGDVFLQGRTTVDLKDKWRNITCRGSPKSK